MEKIRRHIIFYGYVQGVGFRYRASFAARHYGLTGWVRNCSDGSVEMEAEGTEADITAAICALEENPWAQIDRLSSEQIPVQNDRSFEIR